MKYLTKITKNNFQFSCDTRISPRTAISALFLKPTTRQVTCDTRISPRTAILARFRGQKPVKISKTVHSRRRLPPAKDTISSWFVVVQMSWFTVVVHVVVQMSWFTVVVHVMVHCHGSLSWFVVVRGSCSPKISRKRSCDPLFNQSENQIHYEISFLMRLLICPFPFKEHTSKELC